MVVYEGCVPFLAVQSGCAVGGPLDKGGWVGGVGGGWGGMRERRSRFSERGAKRVAARKDPPARRFITHRKSTWHINKMPSVQPGWFANCVGGLKGRLSFKTLPQCPVRITVSMWPCQFLLPLWGLDDRRCLNNNSPAEIRVRFPDRAPPTLFACPLTGPRPHSSSQARRCVASMLVRAVRVAARRCASTL